MTGTHKSKRKAVNAGSPCPVCRGDHKCSVGNDDSIFCGRENGPIPGFVNMGRCGDEWTIYRREGDPHLDDNNGQHRTNGHTHNGNGTPSIDWTARATEYQRALTPEHRRELAEILGLPEGVFAGLGIGYMDRGPHWFEDEPHYRAAWTFPEKNGLGQIVGISCRYPNGIKKAIKYGSRGLTIPAGWQDRRGPIYLPEGPSDTATLTAIGKPAIGRPSNSGGVADLAELLKGVSLIQEIVVLGENDTKTNGRWPGRDGAAKVAGELAAKLSRPIRWALPPNGHKDVRAWVNSKKPDPTVADYWSDLDDEFGNLMHGNWETVQPSRQTTDDRQQSPPKPATGFQWEPIDSATFFRNDYRLRFLVKRLLVEGQPGVVGGPKKSLKTSILLALAISLATGKDFLGTFAIPQAVKVAFLSGESGAFTLKDKAIAVCHALGISLEEVGDKLLWQFDLPQLAAPTQLDALKRGLEKEAVKVLFFDPLYLALLAGAHGAGTKEESIFSMGPLLLNITKACLDVGTTPFLAHHTKKGTSASRLPLDLDDLAYAGVAEFARQWILFSRRETYIHGTGLHQLLMNAGGSAGHGGLWALDIQEGVVDDHFEGRRWEVSVSTASEAREEAEEEKEQARTERKQALDKDDESAVLLALDQFDPQKQGAGWNRVQAKTGLSDQRMNRAFYRLDVANIVKETRIEVTIGSDAKRKVRGLVRVTN